MNTLGKLLSICMRICAIGINAGMAQTADLIIQNPTVNPTSVLQGTGVAMSCTLINQGTSTAMTSRVDYFISTDNVWDPSDVLLGVHGGNDSLIAGGTAVRTKSFNIPPYIPVGFYYILYFADYPNNVAESNETNNVSSKPVTILGNPYVVDFIVQNPSVNPTTIMQGTTASASCTVTNQGGQTASPSGIEYFLSTDTVWDAHDRYVGGSSFGTLTPGSSAPQNATLFIPSILTPPGNYYILFFVDAGNFIDEGNETNNVRRIAVTVIATNIDLLIQNPTINPVPVPQGMGVSVSCQITNQGTAPAPVSTVTYFLSTDNAWDTSDVNLSAVNGSTLQAGASAPRPASLVIPSATAPGNYYILSFADYQNEVTETNETNNVNSIAVTVITSTIDLLIQSPVVSPGIAFPGTQVSVSCTLSNPGNRHAVSGRLGYYLSSDTLLDATDSLLHFSGILGVAAGGNLAQNVTFNIPDSIPSGNYYILFVADYLNTVAETNENNNIGNALIVVPDVAANGPNVWIKASKHAGCSPLSVQFSDSTAPGFVIVSRTWNLGSNYTTSAQSPTRSFPVGNYTASLIVQDINGIKDTAFTTITVYPYQGVGLTAVDVSCSGNCTGSIHSVVPGGIPPYSYSWSNNDTTADIAGLCAGYYSLTVIDINGCLMIGSATINPTCDDSNLCTIDSCNGGICIYTAFTCDDADLCTTDSCAGGIGACIFTPIICNDADACTSDSCVFGNCVFTSITCDDNNLCTTIDSCIAGNCSFGIFLTASISTTPATPGNCDGTATVNITGGVPPYNYQWTPSVACTTNCTGLCGNTTYLLMVSDSSCSIVYPVAVNTINQHVWIKATPNSGCTPLQVQFSDSAASAFVIVSWLWDFGDASLTSSQHNPLHTYAAAGIYPVRLIVQDTSGVIDTAYTTVNVAAPISITTQVFDVTCNGAIDGAVTIHVSGGHPPYPIQFFDGQFAIINTTFDSVYTAFGVPAGDYIAIAGDTGCIADTAFVTVGEPSPLVANPIVQDESCNGMCNGAATIHVTGGTPRQSPFNPYNFTWSIPLPDDSSVTGLCAGPYFVTVTDANGCSLLVTPVISSPPLLTIQSITLQSPTSCPGSNGSIQIVSSGGILPHEWSIDRGTSFQASTLFDSLSFGSYSISVRDIGLCTADSIVYLPQGIPVNQVQLNFSDTLICTTDTVSLIASPGFLYNWTDGDSAQVKSITYVGLAQQPWIIYATDSDNCISFDSAFVKFDTACVWPGDVNYDGIANNVDVLDIGVAYSAAGPVRPNASIVWNDQAADFWPNAFPTGANYKHADCNGDGVVDYNDTLAISLNYGFTHTKGSRCAGGPPLLVDLPDTLHAGENVTAPILLGNVSNLVTGLYGVAFTIFYDNNIIDTGSVSVSYDNSWMGTSGIDLLGFSKNFYLSDKTEVAIVRTDQTNLTQNAGQIGTFSFTIKDNISGQQPVLEITIDNVTAIDKDKNLVFICGQPDSSTAVITDGIKDAHAPQMSIYPNPADNLIYIESNQSIKNITLTDLLGKAVKTKQVAGNNTTLEITDLPESTYLLRLEFKTHVEFRKMLIAGPR